MAPKTIKISRSNYTWLSQLSGELQKSRGRPVSFDEALIALRSQKLSDLAGSWKMSDKEAKEMLGN